ncbi:hypothetical protein SO802_009531 [Lithocarpus litseifolius]|uniref:Uncharacterized protein n=1 Tax=Lithocarpus litseifolius TaxID=425828 RepID=A0AAW2DD12_9ROSI
MSIETPLLLDTATNAVDYKGRRVLRSNSGGWRSACFMIGVEVAERFAYYGISCNLIMYLTEQLGQSTATAAENVNTWLGMASLLPLLGAFVADSYLGRYCTIIIASCIYILGLGLLTLSAMLTSISTSNDMGMNKVTLGSSELQVILFFVSLYLVAVAQGGHKPCIQAFGADQFDVEDPVECRAKSSFFNWWYFGLCSGSSVATLIISYVQENLSWGLGFGIPCVVMVVALGLFLLGTRTYRYSIKEVKSPFVRIGRVFVTAIKNRRAKPSEIAIEEEACRTLPQHNFEQFKFFSISLVLFFILWLSSSAGYSLSKLKGSVATSSTSKEEQKVEANCMGSLVLVPHLASFLGHCLPPEWLGWGHSEFIERELEQMTEQIKSVIQTLNANQRGELEAADGMTPLDVVVRILNNQLESKEPLTDPTLLCCAFKKHRIYLFSPHGIFHLSDPAGVPVVRNCQQRGFHPHEEPDDGSPIYEHCSHVYMNPSLKYDVVDLR